MEIRIADKDTLDRVARAVGVEGNNKIYGVRINKKDSNPMTRCEYLGDAIGKKPARMNFEAGVFNYGDWEDAWFIKDNFPCMLNPNGSIAYKLNPNDYSLKEDGTASDVADYVNNGYNAMSAIPTVWLWQYELGDYEYIYVANYKVNSNYEAFAHQKEDGSIAPYTFMSIYKGSDPDGDYVLRSVSGQPPLANVTFDDFIGRAQANSSGWNVVTWSQRNLIRCLLTLISCSTDSQSSFGMGYGNDTDSFGEHTTSPLNSGTLDKMGQFYGYNDPYHRIKVFHIEDFWGNTSDRIVGLAQTLEGEVRVKMTPPYGFDIETWDIIQLPKAGAIDLKGYPSATTMSKFGLMPTECNGSSSKYLCDHCYMDLSLQNYTFAHCGGGYNVTFYKGAYYTSFNYMATKQPHIGASLSCLP